ncbi:hypothetical protein GGI42DRAFT_200455 [Trichoderma sp. SZMC 28013]
MLPTYYFVCLLSSPCVSSPELAKGQVLTQAPKRGVTQPSGGPKRGGWTFSSLGPVFSALPKIGPAATASPTLLLANVCMHEVPAMIADKWTLLIPQYVLLHRVRDSLLLLSSRPFPPCVSLFCRFLSIFFRLLLPFSAHRRDDALSHSQ